jgi:hypothetical protein
MDTRQLDQFELLFDFLFWSDWAFAGEGIFV